MAVVTTMAHQAKTNNNANNNIDASKTLHHQHLHVHDKAMFHDFLGMKLSPNTTTTDHASPSASSAREPLSTASDIASVSIERQAGNHLEGIPYYGPRSDISGPEISNILVGSKRSNSDSAFMGSTRDGIPIVGHDSVENLHLLKMLKSGAGGDRPRRTSDDDVLYGMQTMKPISSSIVVQPSASNRLDASVSKWDRSIHMGASVQYPPRGGQFVPFPHQVPPNRFRDTTAGPSVISQSAADEGSRTGIKGPGILSSINAGSANVDKNSSGTLPSSSKAKVGAHVSELEFSTPSSRLGIASSTRQMTIFYAGQAHVFDDVHPNKADVIMALAGSNGGSWSTTYASKPNTRPGTEAYVTGGGYEGGGAANSSLQREIRARLPVSGNVALGGSDDRISSPIGHHSSIMKHKESRNLVHPGETGIEEKKES